MTDLSWVDWKKLFEVVNAYRSSVGIWSHTRLSMGLIEDTLLEKSPPYTGSTAQVYRGLCCSYSDLPLLINASSASTRGVVRYRLSEGR